MDLVVISPKVIVATLYLFSRRFLVSPISGEPGFSRYSHPPLTTPATSPNPPPYSTSIEWAKLNTRSSERPRS